MGRHSRRAQVHFLPTGAADGIDDRWIAFADGRETTPACSADAVLVAVPANTVLPAMSACNVAPDAPAGGPIAAGARSPVTGPVATANKTSVGDKLKTWLKNIVH